LSALIDAYDTALFDLDGVVYLGAAPAPNVPGALNELTRLGKKVMYVTNNAARSVPAVVDQLVGFGLQVGPANVLTSAQVAVSALANELNKGAKILVCGSANLMGLLTQAGFEIVDTAADHPDAVIQGYDPDLSWRRLDEATLAIQHGARWYATNADASRPTERGLVPGVGGAISVIATALGGAPTVFGKPHQPLLAEALRRTNAQRAIFVGDRLDTDIVGARNSGLDSLMVFSGAHGKIELVSAAPEAHPDYIGADVGALLEPIRAAEVNDHVAVCRAQRVVVTNGRIVVETTPVTLSDQLDALWAMAQLTWNDPTLSFADAISGLGLVP
jgi:glycerol-1-phosphatase